MERALSLPQFLSRKIAFSRANTSHDQIRSTSQSPARFTQTSWGNPDYQKDQREVINRLSVAPPEQIIPQPIFPYFESNKNLIGDKTIPISDKNEVKISGTKSGIVYLRSMRRKIPRWLHRIFPIYDVNGLYAVDKQTNKAWDMFQLWKASDEKPHQPPRKPVQVISMPEIFNAFFSPGKYINLFMLNRLSSDSWLGRLLTNSKEWGPRLEILDAVIPPHEAGHRLQYMEFFPEKDLRKSNPRFINLKLKLLPLFENFLPSVATHIKTQLSNFKTISVEQERNAHAFELGVLRKLRGLGVNLLRGFSNSDIAKTAEFALDSYDKGQNRLPGPNYSRNRNWTLPEGTLSVDAHPSPLPTIQPPLKPDETVETKEISAPVQEPEPPSQPIPEAADTNLSEESKAESLLPGSDRIQLANQYIDERLEELNSLKDKNPGVVPIIESLNKIKVDVENGNLDGVIKQIDSEEGHWKRMIERLTKELEETSKTDTEYARLLPQVEQLRIKASTAVEDIDLARYHNELRDLENQLYKTEAGKIKRNLDGLTGRVLYLKELKQKLSFKKA